MCEAARISENRLSPSGAEPLRQGCQGFQLPCTCPAARHSYHRLSVRVAPADEYLAWSDRDLIRMTLDALGKVQPEVRTAQVVKSVVLKHAQHLIRPAPGAMSARPGQSTPVPNLFLAGDWTQQDYFGSQEGAVRGGRACAGQVLRSFRSRVG